MRRLLALLGVLFGCTLLFAVPAAAHATLITTSPADGGRLQTAPHTVTVTFNENVTLGNLGYLHVTDQSGKRVDARAAYHPGGDGTKVADDLQSGLGDGSYTASYRVISADSHPIAGTIAFVVGNGPLVRGSVGGGSTVNPLTGDMFDVARWISFAGLAGLGGLWLVLTIWPAGRDERRARRLLWAGWGAAALGAVLELLVQGPYSAGTGLGQITSGSLLDDTLHTNYGQLHSLRLLLLGALAVLMARALQPDARESRAEWAVGGGLGLAIAWTFAGAGHAATTSPSWLSIPIDMLHLLAMATWLGGVLMLAVATIPRREPDELRTVLPVFSTVAFTSVALLAASGLYNAWRGIGTVNAIFTTTYGLLVVGKVALLAGVLLVANLSRRLVGRRVAVAYAMTDATVVADPAPALDDVSTERLRRAVIVEAVIALVVLALTSVLVNEPRGKEALVASYRKPVSAVAPLGAGKTVDVQASPGTHGAVTLTFALSDGSSPQSITATATQAAKQIGPLPISLRREGAGVYDGSANLPVGGKWQIDITVTRSTFDAITTDTTLNLH